MYICKRVNEQNSEKKSEWRGEERREGNRREQKRTEEISTQQTKLHYQPVEHSKSVVNK